MRRLAALGLVAALAASPAMAQSASSYPPSRSNGDLAGWLRRETPVDPAKVVDVSPSSVTEVFSAQATLEPRGFVAILHAQALDPDIEKQEGILSWAIPVELECPTRKVRLGAMTGFPGRDIRYGPKSIRGADLDWVAPAPRSPLDNVLRSLCEPSLFKPPLADVRMASQIAPPPSAPKPAAPKPQAAAPPPVALRGPVAPAPTANKSAPPKSTPQATGSVSSAVQVGATPDQAEAKGILAKVQRKFAGDLKGFKAGVVTVTLDGKTVYRVLISGFHTGAEANRVCATLKAGGQACFVRG